MSRCRIFVVCHLPGQYRKSDVFAPICVGAKKDEFPSDYVRDDEGDNIADLNDTYNEMTALYRVWKDPDLHADYIGLAHYRRFLGLGFSKNFYLVPSVSDAQDRAAKTEEYWRELPEDVDMVVPFPAHYSSVKEYYEESHGKGDVEVLLDVFRKYFPSDVSYAEEYLLGSDNYLGNLQVMKKDLFLRYAEWSFNVLTKYIEERKPTGRLFISERITGIFILKSIREGKKVWFAPLITVEPRAGWMDARTEVRKSQTKGLRKYAPLLHALLPLGVWQQYYRKLYKPTKEKK